MKTKTTKENKSRRQSLTQDRIIQGAVELADDIGVDALTIRKLANALNVKPMTYRALPVDIHLWEINLTEH